MLYCPEDLRSPAEPSVRNWYQRPSGISFVPFVREGGHDLPEEEKADFSPAAKISYGCNGNKNPRRQMGKCVRELQQTGCGVCLYLKVGKGKKVAWSGSGVRALAVKARLNIDVAKQRAA